MTATKTPTASGISRLLAAARFERAVVKMRGGASGFRVSNADPGAVWVWHYSMLGTSRNREAEKLAKYATVITDAGYAVETYTSDRLIVTAKPSSPLAAKDGDPR
jgi:hypothetical protein